MNFSWELSIAIVTVINICLGMFWYSPLFLGKVWARAHQFDLRKLKAGVWHYVGSILVSLVQATILAFIIHQFDIATWKSGMLFGVCLWLGLVLPSHFSGVIWAKKPILVYLIDTTYLFCSIVMMTTLVTYLHE